MRAWEYKILPLDTHFGGGITAGFVEELNRLGREGWEVVTVVGPEAWLKRPRPSSDDIVDDEEGADDEAPAEPRPSPDETGRLAGIAQAVRARRGRSG